MSVTERIAPPSGLAGHDGAAPLPVTRIERASGWISLNLGEVWRYRELLYFLTWRDVKVRYKQTALGAAWAIIQPLMTMVVFSLFFGRLASHSVGRRPLSALQLRGAGPLDVLCERPHPVVEQPGRQRQPDPEGLLPAPHRSRRRSVLGARSTSCSPSSSCSAMMAYLRHRADINILWLPLFLLLAVATALGVGLWLSALNVQFRDVALRGALHHSVLALCRRRSPIRAACSTSPGERSTG